MLDKIVKAVALWKKLRFVKRSRHAIEAVQSAKLRRLVSHSFKTVPYYHDLFLQRHLKPDDIQTIQDLKKIPITTKKDMLESGPQRFTSDAYDIRKLKQIKTSGSSGEPFSFYTADGNGSHSEMDAIRTYMLHGLIPTDRVLKFGGEDTRIVPPQKLLSRLFFRRAALSSFCEYQVAFDFYNAYKPAVIRGFISNLYAFCLWLEENGLILDHHPRFIMCSAELVHGYMREKVETIFGARIFDLYATAELGFIASQCRNEDGYHVFEESVIVEFSEPAHQSWLIGTNLDNYATPFIRYNTYDICEPWSDETGTRRCQCGLNTKKIRVISGRDNDFILTPNGDRIAPIDIIFLMRNHYCAVDRFRFVQETPLSIRVEVVANPVEKSDIAERLTHDIRLFTRGLEPQVHVVEQIPLDESGKLRIIRSAL